jgi:hypothetical protein
METGAQVPGSRRDRNAFAGEQSHRAEDSTQATAHSIRAAAHRLLSALHLVLPQYVQLGGPEDGWPKDPKVTP